MNINIIDKYDMLPAGSRVLCAVSGGADSVCLLHLLCGLAEKRKIEVFAAHFEHGLRGEESLRDCRFVQELCAKLNVQCIVVHGDVTAYAEEKRLGIEEAARELRYAFLEKTADELNCDKIATAHNSDDNAETLLFNLNRGSGLAGLRGIPPVRGRIIRPLLGVSRAEIEQYLADNGLSHVEDSSNASDDYSRNFIRHHVMPAMRNLNPAFSEAVCRTSELLRDDEACLASLAENFIEENFDGESIPADRLLSQPRAIATRVLRRLCPEKCSMAHIDALLKLCEGEGLGFVDVPALRVRRERGRLYFAVQESTLMPERELIPGQSLYLPEAGLTVRAEILPNAQEVHNAFNIYYFKYESICGEIRCSSRQPGDELRPIGRNCTKKLKALFLEAGMSQRERDLTPVFRDDEGVIAVYGLAVAERCRAKTGDKVIRIEIEREKQEII